MFLPANGGLPTSASKPGFRRVNTSGNSISQWNGITAFRPARQAGPALLQLAGAGALFEHTHELLGVARAQDAPRRVLVALEEGRHDQVAAQAHVAQHGSQASLCRARLLVGVARVAQRVQLAAQSFGHAELPVHELPHQRKLLVGGCPS